LKLADFLMDEQSTKTLRWEPFVWRAVLGGVIGNMIVILIASGSRGFVVGVDREFLRDFLVIGSVLALTSGALMGIGVGYVIYRLTLRWGRQPGIMVRIAVGLACCLVLTSSRSLISLKLSAIGFDLVYALLVGGVAGLMAHAGSPPVAEPF
jgi:hypothetical protein